MGGGGGGGGGECQEELYKSSHLYLDNTDGSSSQHIGRISEGHQQKHEHLVPAKECKGYK